MVSTTSSGALTLNTDGSFTYTANANFNGSDSFTYRANDGTADSNVVTVAITVNAVNDAPVAVVDSHSVNEDLLLSVVAPGVLGNDTDVDGNPLTAVLVSTTSSGALTLNTDGSFTYTANANFNGSDSFTYRANDGTADSNVVTVAITVNAVNDAPVAVVDSHSVNEDLLLSVVAPGVLGNDTDVDGNPLTAVLVSTTSSGALTLNTDGSFTYTANANFNGSDSFTYRANDGTADSNVVTVAITVNAVNDAPDAIDDAATVAEDSVANSIIVLANDSFAPDTLETLTITAVTNGANGTVAIAGTTATYTPNANYFGSDSFTYTISDGNGGTDTATVNVTVNNVNDAPVAQFGAAPTSGPGPLAVAFTDASTDIDNAIAGWSWNFGDGGTSAAQNPNYTYTQSGTFTAQLTVTDAAGASHSTTATITVTAGIGINDVVATEGGTATFNVSLAVPPATGNTVTVNYATADGTAAAGADYTAASGTVTFNAGESVKPVTIAIINDTKAEFAEDFFVNLSGASANTVIDDAQGRCEIAVDDAASVSIADVTVDENGGTAVFTVSLSTDADFVITLDYATADNTASAGSDYAAMSGNLVFAIGATSRQPFPCPLSMILFENQLVKHSLPT